MVEEKQKLVEVENLKVHFPIFGGVLSRRVATVKAVDGISFSINRKETIGMVGESGCGKTTVGRALVAILRQLYPEVEISGSIKYHDHGKTVDFAKLKANELRKYRSKVQMIFQDPFASLDPRMSVGDLVAEPMVIHGIATGAERRERVAGLFERVGLSPDQMSRYAHEFSGGQRQRICIARALALRPKLIVADESVSALDVSVQARVLELLRELQADFGIAYLFISHDMAVVENISDRVAVMYAGQIVEVGDAASFFEEPLHPYSRMLMASVPRLRGETEPEFIVGQPPSLLDLPIGCRFADRCPLRFEKCAQEPPVFEKSGSTVKCWKYA